MDHQFILKSNTESLLDTITLTKSLWDELLIRGLIDHKQKLYIQSTVATEREQLEIILKSVQSKTLPSYLDFRTALTKSGQEIIVLKYLPLPSLKHTGKDIRLPKPEPPAIENRTHNSITVSLEQQKFFKLSLKLYNLAFKNLDTGENKREEIPVEEVDAVYTIHNLQSGSPYKIKLQLDTILGKSEESEYSKIVETLPFSAPEILDMSNKKPYSVSLRWSGPTGMQVVRPVHHYVIELHEQKINEWSMMSTPLIPSRPHETIYESKLDVKPNTQYKVQVFACDDKHIKGSGSGEKMYFHDIKLKDILKAKIVKEGKLTEEDVPLIYKIPLQKRYLKTKQPILKYEFGSDSYNQCTEKVVLILGETGSGKTTLINSFFNYITGVQWEDKFRFRLPDTSNNHTAISETSSVTCFTFHYQEGFRIPYTLTLIDTPGLGSTQGTSRDNELKKQLADLFKSQIEHSVDHIDAVLILVPAPSFRSTQIQRYIFESVLGLFGKDIEKNILFIPTFSQRNNKEIHESLTKANLPYKAMLSYNNACLYMSNCTINPDTELQKMFWNMGDKSSLYFFTRYMPPMKSITLNLTTEVLTERLALEVLVRNIQFKIHIILHKLQNLFHALLKKQKCTYESTGDICIAPKSYTTYCDRCKHICHFECPCEGQTCLVMTNNHCSDCPGKCTISDHKRIPYEYDIFNEPFKTGKGEEHKMQLKGSEFLVTMLNAFETIRAEIIGLSQNARKSIERLQKIALKSSELSTAEYIDLLIKTEGNVESKGRDKRVKQLECVKEQAEYMTTLAEQGFDPFEKYKLKFQEESVQKDMFTALKIRVEPNSWEWL